jgi:tetratricopeptide (TPR) repeat protein
VAISELDLERAAALYEECLPLLRSQGNASRLGSSLGNLGTIAHMRGDYATAAGHYREAIEVHRSSGDADGEAVNLHNLGRSELKLGRTDRGVEALRESLVIARRLGYREVIAYCLGGFAEAAMLEEDAPRAAKLLGASRELFSEIGRVPDPDEAEAQERVAAFVAEALGAEPATELCAVGAALDLDELLEGVASRT